jgi:hypothetical protein
MTIGNPDGCEKKGVKGWAKGIVVKRKGIARLTQIGARGGWRGRDSGPSQIGVNKSEARRFEWSLLTLDSVARGLLLSQEIFYKYSNEKWMRTEKKNQSQNPHP